MTKSIFSTVSHFDIEYIYNRMIYLEMSDYHWDHAVLDQCGANRMPFLSLNSTSITSGSWHSWWCDLFGNLMIIRSRCHHQPMKWPFQYGVNLSPRLHTKGSRLTQFRKFGWKGWDKSQFFPVNQKLHQNTKKLMLFLEAILFSFEQVLLGQDSLP